MLDRAVHAAAIGRKQETSRGLKNSNARKSTKPWIYRRRRTPAAERRACRPTTGGGGGERGSEIFADRDQLLTELDVTGHSQRVCLVYVCSFFNGRGLKLFSFYIIHIYK